MNETARFVCSNSILFKVETNVRYNNFTGQIVTDNRAGMRNDNICSRNNDSLLRN